jgi:hypothetical protein
MVHNKTTPPHPFASVLQNMEMIRPELDCTNKYNTYVMRKNTITVRNKNIIQNFWCPIPSTGTWEASRLNDMEK